MVSKRKLDQQLKEESVANFKGKLANIILQQQAREDELSREKEIDIPSTGYK